MSILEKNKKNATEYKILTIYLGQIKNKMRSIYLTQKEYINFFNYQFFTKDLKK